MATGAISRIYCGPNWAPYGHVRFNLNGESLFLPAKLAVSLALIFHELATNAGKYGAFASPRGLLQVSWTVSDERLNVIWDETEDLRSRASAPPASAPSSLKSALRPFDGKTEISYLRTGVHCTMQCRIPLQLRETLFQYRNPQMRSVKSASGNLRHKRADPH